MEFRGYLDIFIRGIAHFQNLSIVQISVQYNVFCNFNDQQCIFCLKRQYRMFIEIL